MGCKRFALILLLAGLAGLTAAEAAVKAGPNVMGSHHRLKTPTASGPPFGAASGLYSFRKIGPGFGGSAIRLRRASDNAQQDIGFAGSDFDTAAATTFCNATSCFVAKWYDQAPAAQDFSQATAALQPALLFACLNGIPCVSFTPGSLSLAAPSVSQTGIVTLNIMINRAAGTGICVMPGIGGNTVKTRSGVAGLSLNGGIGSITTSSADVTWHSATGVINGASSSFAVDGTTTTGSITGSTSSAGPSLAGISATTCNIAEMGFWQAYAMSAAEVASLNSDQHTYWGF